MKYNEEDRYAAIRPYIRKEFCNIPTKDLQIVLRCFSNIKNLISKDYDKINPPLIKNKAIVLKNVLEAEYVKNRLRKEVVQSRHAELNSLLLITKIIKVEKNVPYSVEFFEAMMR